MTIGPDEPSHAGVRRISECVLVIREHGFTLNDEELGSAICPVDALVGAAQTAVPSLIV